MIAGLAHALEAAFGAARVGRLVPLAPMTTFKVGGPADLLLETRTSAEIAQALALAYAEEVPVTVLGGGSNVLIGDGGIRGLVIRPRGGEVVRESDSRVRADAAVTINGLVRWTINHGCAGLEQWAGTPGTVGGAVFGNAHFGGHLIGGMIEDVRLAARDGRVFDVPAGAMEFAYDRSRLQTSGEVLLSAVFRVTRGEPAALRAIARASLAFRKRTQPLDTSSAGCVFQNPDPEHDHLPAGIPYSAGALVDRAGLKGTVIGGASVSGVHANFIVNTGRATAADIRALIDRCKDGVRRAFGVVLREEIVYLGDFDSSSADRQTAV